VATTPREDGSLNIDRYEIDFRLCMYCGLCVEACPYEAIQAGGPTTTRSTSSINMFREQHALTKMAQEHLRTNDHTYPNGKKAPLPEETLAVRNASWTDTRKRLRFGRGLDGTLSTGDGTQWLPSSSTATPLRRRRGAFVGGPAPRRHLHPQLCYLEGLPPYAGCRMCLVEIEGARGLQLSCTSKVADGMQVRTNTRELAETRKAVLSIIWPTTPTAASPATGW